MHPVFFVLSFVDDALKIGKQERRSDEENVSQKKRHGPSGAAGADFADLDWVSTVRQTKGKKDRTEKTMSSCFSCTLL
jgi:hypothetical protein